MEPKARWEQRLQPMVTLGESARHPSRTSRPTWPSWPPTPNPVPHECLGWAFVEIGQVVSQRAAVEGVARGSDLCPDGEQFAPGEIEVALAAEANGSADGVHRWVWSGGGCGHEGPVVAGPRGQGITSTVRSPSSAERTVAG